MSSKKEPLAAVIAFTSTSEGADAPALDLNQYAVNNPNSTFYLQVDGSGWEQEGIYEGDVLAIDKSLVAKPGDIVVAVVDGEMVLMYLKAGKEIELWGVVATVIRKLH